MKKINLLSAVLILFFTASLFAQQVPTVKDSILVEDLAGAQKWLTFGLDPLASDNIDILFGESDLPPFPPIGAFEARFFLPENNFTGTLGTYDDYRFMDSIPYTGTKEFRLAYQVGFGTEIKLTWNFPENVTGQLLDIITGTLINVPMVFSGTYTIANPSAFNRLKMLIHYNAITPVELVSFGASINENSVNLNWQTATELNNSGFEVQKKTENTDWQNIGFVSGAGTTSEIHNYSFSDGITDLGVIKYRIKQIDFDGTFSYSKEVELDLGSITKFNLNQNYPNPFNPSTTISFSLPGSSNVALTIFNQIGEKVEELVNKNLEAGFYTYNWDASKYSSGNYFYELKTNESKSVRKMTLIK
jgi:hypothetical protein